MLNKFNELPDWISRGLDDLFPYDNSVDSDQSFQKRLELSSIEKKPLRVKLGIDPTGKSKTRVQLSKDEVEANAMNYLEQLGLGKEPKDSLIDFSTPSRLEIRRNSEWLENLNLSKVIELLSSSTVGQMLAKEDFSNRYKSGTSYISS